MRRLQFRPRAEKDLSEIWLYISQDNVAAADKVVAEIKRALGGLRLRPGKGHTRRDVKDKAYRFWVVYSYVIAYQFDARTVTVIRIVHGRRDFRRLFPR